MATHFEDSPHGNPIFADRGLILRSTCGEQQQRPEQPKRMTVPPIIGEIVANLGLRYRPSGKVDLEAHAETLILLGQDCADMPPPLLDAAAKRWARESKFMPKASELRETALAIQADALRGSEVGTEQLRAHCDKLNSMSWVRLSGKPFIISKREVDGQTIRFVDRAA